MKRFHVTTFGCQMNEHDSERMKGMLESLGYAEAPARDQADLILFNTCSIREKADSRFVAHLGEAKRLKSERPEERQRAKLHHNLLFLARCCDGRHALGSDRCIGDPMGGYIVPANEAHAKAMEKRRQLDGHYEAIALHDDTAPTHSNHSALHAGIRLRLGKGRNKQERRVVLGCSTNP